MFGISGQFHKNVFVLNGRDESGKNCRYSAVYVFHSSIPKSRCLIAFQIPINFVPMTKRSVCVT